MCSSFTLNYLSKESKTFSVSFGFYVLGIDLSEMQTRFILTSRYRFNTLLASGAGIITIIKITQSQLAVGAPQSLEPM